MEVTRLVRCLFLVFWGLGAVAPGPACDLHEVKPSEQACLLNQLLRIITHLVHCNPENKVTPESYKKLLEATSCSRMSEQNSHVTNKPPQEPVTTVPEQPVTEEPVTEPKIEIITLHPPPVTPLPLVATTDNLSKDSEESAELSPLFPSNGPILPITWFPTYPFSEPDSEPSEESSEEKTAVTLPPPTEPPLTEPPVTEPLITSPPITSPLITSPPITVPPITVPPITVPPITLPPIISPPISINPQPMFTPDKSSEVETDALDILGEERSTLAPEVPVVVPVPVPIPIPVIVPEPTTIPSEPEPIGTILPQIVTTSKHCEEKDFSEEEQKCKEQQFPFRAETFFIPVLKFHGANCMSAEELKDYLFNYLSCPNSKKT